MESFGHAFVGDVNEIATGDGRLLLGNGKTTILTGKAGQAEWTPAGIHTPTNLSDKPFEAILVELKSPKK